MEYFSFVEVGSMWHVQSQITTVLGEIVVLGQNFTVCRDWMKTCHVVQTPVADWKIPPPVLSSARQLFYHVLYIKLR